ncbi:MAG: hypothetical protein IPF58_01370 [Saprospirales bacterium]|nr:hypothetical protein [Saprospirales bacterium]
MLLFSWSFLFLLFRLAAQVAIHHLWHPNTNISWKIVAPNIYGNIFKLNTAGYFKAWWLHNGIAQIAIAVFFVFVLIIIEKIIGDNKIEQIVLSQSTNIRWLMYILLFIAIVWFGEFNNTTFVYFQY